MNPITPWLVCFALLLMLVFAVYAAIKSSRRKNQQIKELEGALEAQKKVSSELVHYAEEIGKINGDEQKISEQINEAKNEEEVMAIIAGLVHTNNDRVRK